MSSNNVKFAPPSLSDASSGSKAAFMAEKLNGLCSKQLLNRDIEMVRLIGQYLCDKGYSNAYEQLAKDSGIILEPQPATDLRAAILAGNWDATEKAVDQLSPTINNSTNLAHIRFLLLEQQFLELLEQEEVIMALTLLRNRITPLHPDPKRLQNLAQCLMCRTPEEVRAQAGGWSGTNGVSRSVLVDCIQRFMPAQTMLPPGRLETLVAEAVRSQINTCTFHTQPVIWPDTLDSISLLQPHSCSIRDFPVFPVQTVEHRDTELYFAIFSPDGALLATGGKDPNVDLWRVDAQSLTISFYRTLFTTAPSINHLCWSPDSKKLAVCCGINPGPILVFDVQNRRQICQKHIKEEDVYGAATFFADSRKLAFGGLKGGCFYIIDTEEEEGRLLVTHDYVRVQSMVAIPSPPAMPPPTAAMVVAAATLAATGGLTADTAIDLDSPNPSTLPAAATIEQLLQPPTDQLLVVDHMYRIRLFKFGYTPRGGGAASAATGGDSTASTTATTAATNPAPPRARIILPQDVESAAWMTAAAAVSGSGGNAGGGAGGGSTAAAPIFVALQAAQAALSTYSTRAQLDSSAGSGPGASMRQTTSDSSISGVGPGRGRHQVHIASTPGSVMGSGGTESIFQIAGTSGDPSAYTRSPAIFTRLMQNYAAVRNAAFLPPTPLLVSGAASGSASGAGGGGTSLSRAAASTGSHSAVIQEGDVPGVVGDVAADVSTSTDAAAANSTSASTSASSASQNHVYGLLHHSTIIKEIYPVQSILLSPSGKRLLVGLNAKGLVLWDLESRGIIQRFYGHHQVQQRLFYTFCGLNEDFVACGSENGYMHLWHVGPGPENSRPIHSTMAANVTTKSVSAVHWNPAIPSMMVSVNDEGEIRIWGPANKAAGFG